MIFAAILFLAQGKEVRVEVSKGRFSAPEVRVPAGAALRLVNRDNLDYTVESPGAFVGDVLLEGRHEAVVHMLRGGTFVAMIEERPDSEIRLNVEADPNAPRPSESPFDLAKDQGLQPLDLEGPEPAYGAITQFDLAVTGQLARQALLQELYRLEEELSGDRPPPEFSLYFSAAEWKALRTSVAMVVGLGPTAFDRRRFGPAVTASKPAGLHQAPKIEPAKSDSGQRDMIVRVTSDSAWFNLRVCRLIWQRFGTRISRRKLEWGYSGPAGRSPILGGFYDGTGNPSGAERRKTEFGQDRTSMLAVFRIRFDEDRFLAIPLAKREAAIGRERMTGRSQKKAADTAHRMRTSSPNMAIVRMPLIFDEGSRGTGLLFLAAGRSFQPLELFLTRMSAVRSGTRDRLMNFMHFESEAYYEIPPSPKGGYPGSLRKTAFTFGS